MGKKSGSKSNGMEDGDDPDMPKATVFVLKVPMHCRCNGCADKIRAAVKDLTPRFDGILLLDQSALGTRGELAVVATADPERLHHHLHKATGKSVDLVFPKPTAKAADGGSGKDAAALQALIAGMHLQQQPVHAHLGQPLSGAGWNALHHSEYGQAAAAYPWLVQHQQQAPPSEPYVASYPVAAYPTASWGAYEVCQTSASSPVMPRSEARRQRM